jgi:8-oxo-dGTP pyrophosphatase MutT (NUDIX family)
MNDYIKTMRKFIGHNPLLLCGASIIIYNDHDQVLMLRRSDNGCWCFPGGAIELGERAEDSVRRELYEETGLRITDLKIFGVFSGEELHYTYPNGDEVYIVDIVFTSHIPGAAHITIDNESKEHAFFNVTDIPDEISPPVIPIVKELKQRTFDGGIKDA